SQDAAFQGKLGLVVYRMVPPGPNDKPAMPGMPALPGVETVSVETGERVDDLVVITKGDLKPGDMLVTRGKEGLYPGAKIIPTNLMPKGGEGGGKGAAGAGGSAKAGGAEAGAGAAADGTGGKAGDSGAGTGAGQHGGMQGGSK